MHLRYIRLDKIREAFSERYSPWRVKLPERLAPSGEIDDSEFKSRWIISYALGYDENGSPCLFVADDHRMTNPSLYVIRETGKILGLASYPTLFFFHPEIKGDHDKQEQEYYRRNKIISSFHRLCGVDWHYSCFPESENIEDGQVFFADDSPFSLRHPCSFIAFGLGFHSAVHYYEWLRATHDGLLDMAEGIYAAPADDPIFSPLRNRHVVSSENINSRGREIRWLYEANRDKFLQNNDLRDALLATRGALAFASRSDDFWGRMPGSAYEREEKGNCLGAALSLLREDLRNEREYYSIYSSPSSPFFIPKK
jgi:predicted NAD-dependent protein-ADP-ribosyltransferase YbiA (DUF1768 family)